MIKKEKLVDDMKKLCGIPPHDVGSNICLNDGYFGHDLRKRICTSEWSWDDIHKQAVKEGRQTRPHWDNF